MGVVEQLPAPPRPYTQPRPIETGDSVQDFGCGKRELDDWLKQRALKNQGKASRTYVVCSNASEDGGRVVGFYSLSAGAVRREDAPGWARKNMPNPLPIFVLGRLAIDAQHQHKGLGMALLREALQRTLEASRRVAGRALVVHAIDDDAVSFYVAFGFQAFPPNSRTLFLPIETIVASLEGGKT